MRVKGRSQAVTIHTVRAREADMTPELAEELRLWGTMLHAWRNADYAECETKVRELRQRNPVFTPYQLYEQRIMQQRPQKDAGGHVAEPHVAQWEGPGTDPAQVPPPGPRV